MLSYTRIKQFLAFTPAPLSEIVFELRNLVADITPDATEEIRHGGLVYFFGDSGGPVSAGICGIAIKPDHIRLYFTHGAFIPDPNGLLKGTGKAMRYIRLWHYDDVPWIDIKILIEEHANFDPRSLQIY
jgi:hypothetical protein